MIIKKIITNPSVCTGSYDKMVIYFLGIPVYTVKNVNSNLPNV